LSGFDESFARQEFSRVEKVSYEGRTRHDNLLRFALLLSGAFLWKAIANENTI
jgi:hypothetical protein